MESIKKFFNRLRNIWQLSIDYDKNRNADNARLQSQINTIEDRLGEHTIVHADIHWKSNQHQIIVVGRYRESDYVRVFNLEAESWKQLVDMLHSIEKNAKVGMIDAHPHSFSVVYGRDRF